MLLESLQSGKQIYHFPQQGDTENLAKYIYSFISNYKATIKKNNQILSSSSDKDDDVEFRDQGFTRPVVLVLAPFRNSAFELVNSLIETSSIKTIQSRKRFLAEFGPGEQEQRQEQDLLTEDDSTSCEKRASLGSYKKPPDGETVHSDSDMTASVSESDSDLISESTAPIKRKLPESPFKGNVDDHFRLGIRIGSRSISLYEKFYGSDLIIASPLSLRILIGSKGDTSMKHDHDFLSSLRLLIILEADVINMQNWDHLLHVHEHINLIPTKSYACDFSRIHPLLLDGKGKEALQTLISTKYATPEINSFWRALPKEKIGSTITASPSINTSMPPKWTAGCKLAINFFLKRSEDSVNTISYFDSEVLSAIAKMKGNPHPQRICIYVPSYLDYVQIKAKLQERGDIAFKAVSDYSSDGEIIGARSSFFNRHTRVLLLSERLLYFKRLLFRGIEQLIFFGPPTDPSLYDHLVHYCMPIDNGGTNCQVPTVSMYVNMSEDALALERLVGPEPIAAHYGPSALNRMLVER
ncbi:rRNA-binding ribosome biosynthesis protein utp25 [Mitosporidium daphniae]